MNNLSYLIERCSQPAGLPPATPWSGGTVVSQTLARVDTWFVREGYGLMTDVDTGEKYFLPANALGASAPRSRKAAIKRLAAHGMLPGRDLAVCKLLRARPYRRAADVDLLNALEIEREFCLKIAEAFAWNPVLELSLKKFDLRGFLEWPFLTFEGHSAPVFLDGARWTWIEGESWERDRVECHIHLRPKITDSVARLRYNNTHVSRAVLRIAMDAAMSLVSAEEKILHVGNLPVKEPHTRKRR